MRNLRELDKHREVYLEVQLYGTTGDEFCGVFSLASPTDGQRMQVIASSYEGWDHVSVSRSSRCPNWPEMEYVKRKLFRDDECAMQLHPPLADYVDGRKHGECAHCLHLWRPHGNMIPRPPMWMIKV